jgi:hypothetical protein
MFAGMASTDASAYGTYEDIYDQIEREDAQRDYEWSNRETLNDAINERRYQESVRRQNRRINNMLLQNEIDRNNRPYTFID